jgi:fucose 4-O-acetylase-like acetyltransferase
MQDRIGERRYDLDWLRVIAFGLLILCHTGMMFVSWYYHVKNPETSVAPEWVMRFVHEWRMPLLFFISGAAVSRNSSAESHSGPAKSFPRALSQIATTAGCFSFRSIDMA